MTMDKLALVAFRVVVFHRPSELRHGEDFVRRRDNAEAEAEGNGPMGALFRATDAAVGVRGEVTGLRIYAFDNNGMVGKARITVGFEGRKYGGRGSSPDAVEAAAHAYLRAVATYLSDEVQRSSTE